MRIAEKKIYKFEELSDEAKQKAIDWYRSGNEFYDDYIIDDAKAIARLFGLEIAEIYYSGFYTQGSYTSFTGTYRYKSGALKIVNDYTGGTDSELLGIVKALQEIQRKSFYGIFCRIGQFRQAMSFDVEVERQTYSGMEDDLKKTLSEFAQWIYSKLEKEYEFTNADEQISESIIANEYEFDENGKRN